MKKRAAILNSLIAFVLIVCCVFASRISGECAETKKGSIAMTFTVDEGKTPVSGIEVTVYKVAEYSVFEENVCREVEVMPEFSDFGVDIDKANDPQQAYAAGEYIKERQIKGTVKTTGADGTVKFEELPLGLYLVMQTDQPEKYTITEAFFISVPSKEGDTYIYDINATPKVSIVNATSITVKKIWNDDGPSSRPSFIKVALLRNGNEYDEVTLSEKNNWNYVWTRLAATDEWTIEEIEVPVGYIATYKNDGYIFIIENTPTLIQSGQLKWPVPFLAALGVFLILLGLYLGRKKNED